MPQCVQQCPQRNSLGSCDQNVGASGVGDLSKVQMPWGHLSCCRTKAQQDHRPAHACQHTVSFLPHSACSALSSFLSKGCMPTWLSDSSVAAVVPPVWLQCCASQHGKSSPCTCLWLPMDQRRQWWSAGTRSGRLMCWCCLQEPLYCKRHSGAGGRGRTTSAAARQRHA